MNIDQEDDRTAPEASAEAPKKKHTGGWPAGKPRGPKAATRTAAPRAGVQRTRKIKGGAILDKFYIDPAVIPHGISYEWKTETVYGANNPAYDGFMRNQGWEPVDAKRHPDMMPDGYKGPVRREGLILMERPIELTREAMMEERMAANEAVQIKEEQLGNAPKGTLPRARADGSSTINVNRTIERGGLEIE